MILRASILVLIATVAAAAPAAAEDVASQERLYLMASDAEYRYWTTDPADPELDAARSVVAAPYASFLPAARLLETARWTTEDPLRFRLTMEVTAVAPFTVHLVVETPTLLLESPAATEVMPGVFEGTLAENGSLNPSEGVFFGIRVKTAVPRVTQDIRTAGESWIELPEPVSTRTVPQLLADSTYATDPSSLTTDTRGYTFNDRDWTLHSFEGDLSQERDHPFTMDRRAEILIVWVEAFDTPFLHDVVRGRPPNAQKLTDAPRFLLTRDGEVVSGADNGRAEGTVANAALDVAGGDFVLTVRLLSASQGHPYRAHVLAIHGKRTLRSMHWRFSYGSAQAFFRGPVGQNCPQEYQPVPVPPESSTFMVDLDWDSVGTPGRWTPNYSLPGFGDSPCGETGTGDRLRLTMPLQGVLYFNATPSPSSPSFASYNDTVFSFEVRYAYTPPPIL